MGQQFDDLAKALASGSSRRTALRTFASGVLGAAMASLIPGRPAEAATNSSAACAKFCNTSFGAYPYVAIQCLTDSVKGKGLCYECGPKASKKNLIPCGDVCCPSDACLRINGGQFICII